MMKKRNFNILIIAILIIMGAYFIYAAVISKKPGCELKDISGDRRALGDLVITKKVFVSSYSYVKSIIDKDFVKMEEGSFDINRGMDYEDSVYEDFYLGKNIMRSRMAQNEKYLFFGEVNYKPGKNTALDIRIMNKGSKEVKDINLPIENNDYGFTQAVGILGSKGIVSVSIQDKKNFKVSTRIYSFNLETGEKINELSVDKNLQGNNISSKTQDGYIILMSAPKEDGGKNLKQSNELFLYDIKQDKYKIIDLKDINTYKLAAVGTLDDLYLIDTDILKVYKVDVEKNSTEEKGTIVLENGAQISEAAVSKERMYIAGGRGPCNNWINVYNIDEGMKKLYEGEIKVKGGIAMSGILELNLLK